MIVIERAYMAKIIRALKAAMNSEDRGIRPGTSWRCPPWRA